jgi:hypothetical protein
LPDRSDILILTPVPCGAVTLRDRDGPLERDPVLLRSEEIGVGFLSAISFDLSALPMGSVVRFAGLELAGIDQAAIEDYGHWSVRFVDLDPETPLREATWRRILEAPAAAPCGTWRVAHGSWRDRDRASAAAWTRSDAAAPRPELLRAQRPARRTLVLEQPVLDEIALRLGSGSVTFRIDGPKRRARAFAWPAEGPFAPRLRLGYLAMPGTDARTVKRLVRWQD